MVGAIILEIIVFVVTLIFLVSIIWPCFSLAGWVPTLKKDLKRIAKIVDLKPGQTFCELGAGNGRVSFYIAKKFPKSKVIAIELALPLFIIGKIKEVFGFSNNISFKWRNLFQQDLSKVDVIYIFALPKPLDTKLREKFEKELKPGSRVVSYAFKMKSVEPKLVHKPKNQNKSIYVYEF